MSTRTILISLFWIIVIGGLIYSFWVPPAKTVVAHSGPHQPNSVFPVSHVKPGNGRGLRQSRYLLEFHKSGSGPGKYVARITVVNDSTLAFKNIKIHVRPFRGGDDPEGDTEMDQQLDEFSPISQFGAWVDVPDLKSGGSAEVTYEFPPKLPYQPDENPGPVFKYTNDAGVEVETPDLVAEAAAQKKAREKAALKAGLLKAANR